MGIATGDVILGTVGTETRLDTTVLGHAVNLSSRMEALTTSYGVSIIITESTFKDLVDPEQYKYREIDTVIAKGLSQPNLLYEIFDEDPPRIAGEKAEHSHPPLFRYTQIQAGRLPRSLRHILRNAQRFSGRQASANLYEAMQAIAGNSSTATVERGHGLAAQVLNEV